MKKVALSVVKDDLSKFLRMAENEEIIITRHGKPSGVLVGFESDEDWFEYLLENDPRFLHRIEKARASIKAGKGVRLEEVAIKGEGLHNQRVQRTATPGTPPAKSSHARSILREKKQRYGKNTRKRWS